MTEEIWKDVPGFEGFYQVSNLGRIKSFSKGRNLILKPNKQIKTGYLSVRLFKNLKYTFRTVHSLVAELFIGPCPAEKEVNHKNFIRTDNAAENLEYMTRKENKDHSFERRAFGEKHGMAKLTEGRAKEIHSIRWTISCIAAAKKFEVHKSTILRIWNETGWPHLFKK